MLPKHLTRLVLAAGIEPTFPKLSAWCPRPVDLASSVPPRGVEPRTSGLEAPCGSYWGQSIWTRELGQHVVSDTMSTRTGFTSARDQIALVRCTGST